MKAISLFSSSRESRRSVTWKLLSVCGALGMLLGASLPRLAADDPPKPPVATMPAMAPILYSSLPAGLARGESVEMALSGVYLEPIQTVRVQGGGVKAELIPLAKGKKPNHRRVVVKLTAAPDAQLGMHELRVVTAGGVSNTLRFCVGTLPEVSEQEPNETPGVAMKLEKLPLVVNGQVNRNEDRDCFRFSAKAGQQLVLDLCAARLHPYVPSQRPGWFEGLLTIWKAPEEGKTVTSRRSLAYAHDFGGRQDPLLVFEVPEDGDYVVEVRDEVYRGRAQFYYRLTIGELPYVLATFPAGGKVGTTTAIELFGVNLGDERTFSLTVPKNAAAGDLLRERITTKRGLSNEVVFHVGNLNELKEQEPNDAAEQATAVSVPAMINGIIEREGDFDSYRFQAKKGERLVFQTISRPFTSALDARLDLYDAKGKRLKTNDDWNRTSEARIDHTFAADGEYVIRVGDMTGLGSRRHVYRLEVRPLQPDFSLVVSPDNPRVAAGGAVALKVLVQRFDGFGSDIALSIEGAPAGAKVHSAIIGPGLSEQTLVVQLPTDAKPDVSAIRVVGKAKIGQQDVVRYGIPSEQIRYINTWKYVPAKDMVLASIPAAPCTLQWGQSELVTKASKKTQSVEVPIRIKRGAGFEAAVRVTVQGLPPRVAAPPVTIDAKTNEAKMELRIYGNAPVNLAHIVLISTIRHQGRTLTQASAPLKFKIAPPEEKKAEEKKAAVKKPAAKKPAAKKPAKKAAAKPAKKSEKKPAKKPATKPETKSEKKPEAK